MSKTIDYVVVFVAGLTAGVLCTKEYWKNEYRLRAEEEIASVKAVFSKRYEKENKKEQEPTVTDGNSVPAVEKTMVDFGYSGKPEDQTDYRKFYESEEVKPDIKEKVEVEMAKREAPSEQDKPFLISEEDYSETMEQYDKMSCTFYMPDKLVVDDLSREVVEPDVIGEENIEYLFKTNQETVWVRNDNIGCDLEISKSHESISESGAVVWR